MLSSFMAFDSEYLWRVSSSWPKVLQNEKSFICCCWSDKSDFWIWCSSVHQWIAPLYNTCFRSEQDFHHCWLWFGCDVEHHYLHRKIEQCSASRLSSSCCYEAVRSLCGRNITTREANSSKLHFAENTLYPMSWCCVDTQSTDNSTGDKKKMNIRNYHNSTKGTVDRNGQSMDHFHVQRRTNSWTMRTFQFLTDAVVLNSYHLFVEAHTKKY